MNKRHFTTLAFETSDLACGYEAAIVDAFSDLYALAVAEAFRRVCADRGGKIATPGQVKDGD